MTKHPFSHYISSEREEGIATLSAKKNPTKVFVYVEDISDVGFWHGILSPYEKSNNIKFDISPPYSENSLTTGKNQLIKLFPNTDKHFIICLDSDYEYLLQSELAQIINNNPYIFQTYAYAMENLKCYAESLNSLCISATHNSMDDIIDFSDFLSEYSQIIYPLFIWNLYFYHIKELSNFSISDFNKIVTIGNITPDNCENSLTKLKNAVSERLQEFNSNADIVEFSKGFSDELPNTNAYLFINGHAIYSTVLNFLKEVCKKLEHSHIEQIKILTKTSQECSEKINHYRKSTSPAEALLARNDKFTDCFLFQNIRKDIENYLALFKQNTQGMNNV